MLNGGYAQNEPLQAHKIISSVRTALVSDSREDRPLTNVAGVTPSCTFLSADPPKFNEDLTISDFGEKK